MAGLATAEEFAATSCDLFLSLDRDSSTVTQMGVGQSGDYAALHCVLDAVPVVDTDVVVHSSQPVDSLRVRLVSGQGSVLMVSWPSAVQVPLVQGQELMMYNGGSATAQDFATALGGVRLQAAQADSFAVEVVVWARYGQTDTAYARLRVYDGPRVFSLGGDTTVCDADTLWVAVPDTAWYAYGGQAWGTALWDDGSGEVLRPLVAPGTYWVEVSYGGGAACTWSDTLTVSFGESVSVHDTAWGCSGTPLWAAGGWYETDTTVCVWGQTAEGCDSLWCVTLRFAPPLQQQLDTAVCAGQGVWLGDEWLTGSGTYVDTFAAASGCDSVVVLHLTVHAPDTTMWTASVCAGEWLEWNGEHYSAGGVYAQTFVSWGTGCDSVSVLVLEVVEPVTEFQEARLCPGEGVWLGDEWLTSSGTYVDTFTAANGCDSVVVLQVTEVMPAPLDIAVVQDSCGGRATLSVPGWASVTWADGHQGAVREVTSGGWYAATGVDSVGCEVRDSVWLEVPAVLSAEVEVTDPSCAQVSDGVVTVWATGGVWPLSYALSGLPSEEGTWTGLSAGGYALEVTDGWGCTWRDSVMLSAAAEIGLTVSGGDTSLWPGQRVWLEAQAWVAASSVWWTPGQWLECATCAGTYAQPQASTTYTVWWQTASGCVDTAQVHIEVRPLPQVYAPDVFSPNGDGVNDRFTLFGEGVTIELLEVYGRWGGLAWRGEQFAAGDPAQGWDGRWGDQPAPMDVYVWRARLRLPDGRMVWRRGSVTLVR